MAILSAEKPTANDARVIQRIEKITRKINNCDGKKINFNIPRSLHRKFKIKAEMEGKSMTDIIISYIIDFTTKK